MLIEIHKNRNRENKPCWYIIERASLTQHCLSPNNKGEKRGVGLVVSCKVITRTQTSVWLPVEKLTGKQLYRSSLICQFEIPSLSLCKSGMEGRHIKSSDCNLCKSTFLRMSGKWCSESRSTTFGTCMAVYMVNARNRKNPIKCLHEITFYHFMIENKKKYKQLKICIFLWTEHRSWLMSPSGLYTYKRDKEWETKNI